MSSYRGDLSPSDRADIESFTEAPCKRCGGKGYVGESEEPCGCRWPIPEIEDDDDD